MSTAETVLVTGGTGFLAGWCIVELLRAGYAVRATVRSADKEASVREAVSSQLATDRLDVVVADLLHDEGWDVAMSGCAGVLHVASPLQAPGGDREALVRTAQEGAVRVLSAAISAGVPRVVVTSSCAAATPPPSSTADEVVVDETCWTDPDQPGLSAYRASKAISERAVWDFMAEHQPNSDTELVTMLPAAIFGPSLTPQVSGSLEIFERLLTGRLRALPRLAFEVVDVRDVADAHVRALRSPAAAGQRFILSGELLWMSDIAALLKKRFGAQAGRVPTRRLPDLLMRVGARFSPEVADLVPLLGRRLRHSSAKASTVLGWATRPAEETVYASAQTVLASR